MSGTIATMVHIGIDLIDANWFYLAAAVVSGGIALGIGNRIEPAGHAPGGPAVARVCGVGDQPATPRTMVDEPEP